jgi:hypothetical protein
LRSPVYSCCDAHYFYSTYFAQIEYLQAASDAAQTAASEHEGEEYEPWYYPEDAPRESFRDLLAYFQEITRNDSSTSTDRTIVGNNDKTLSVPGDVSNVSPYVVYSAPYAQENSNNLLLANHAPDNNNNRHDADKTINVNQHPSEDHDNHSGEQYQQPLDSPSTSFKVSSSLGYHYPHVGSFVDPSAVASVAKSEGASTGRQPAASGVLAERYVENREPYAGFRREVMS